MNDVCAIVVGIDTYDQPGWTVDGPCTNALSVAEWLLEGEKLDVKLPPRNLFLFADTNNEAHDKSLTELANRDVHVMRSAKGAEIATFWKQSLRALAQKFTRLFFYWSGHGFADEDGSRIFMCRDYRDPELASCVFNCTNTLRHFHSAAYQGFAEQICLVDACAMKPNIKIHADRFPPDKSFVKGINQVSFFATPEDEYAKGDKGVGVFTTVALEVLDKLQNWPDVYKFANSMKEAFDKAELPIFSVSYYGRTEQYLNRKVGKIAKDAENPLFQSVHDLLAPLPVTDSVYWPHYQRTSDCLGNPELNRAQGLTGMIRELTSLRDAAEPTQAPYGLLQFLKRLLKEDELKEPVQAWLESNASQQGNALANIQEVLDSEAEVKIFVVEVGHNAGEIASLEIWLRTSDLRPVPNVDSTKCVVKTWPEFERRLETEINRLTAHHEIKEFEVHFLVDPPLFHHRFHHINFNNEALGKNHVVLLRHGARLRSADRDLTKLWCDYAKLLRPTKLAELQLLGVPVEAGSQKKLLPTDKGLCYMRFLVNPTLQVQSELNAAKHTIHHLLIRGAPFLYWLHSLPPNLKWEDVETLLKELQQDVQTLQEIPGRVRTNRSIDEELACEMTLLWDDPHFNPFRRSKGVSKK